MSCLKPFDIFLFFVYIFLIANVLTSWDAFSVCKEPIQIFLIECYTLIMLNHILNLARENTENIVCKKIFNYLVYCLVFPGFIAITVNGVIWQVENDKYSPNCIPESQSPWIVWFWIYFFGFMDCLIILLCIIKIVKWWRIRRFRQRIFMLMSELHGQLDLNTLLLAEQAMNQELNQEVGLTHEEIQALPKKQFTEGILSSFQMADTCPICCEDFVKDERIIKLPICDHVYHETCIVDWLVKNPNCPMCRSNVRNNLILSLQGTGERWPDYPRYDADLEQGEAHRNYVSEP